MNYQESTEILNKIKSAKNILLSLHASPDGDSISSNLALYYILKKLEKNVAVISPENIPANLKFVEGADSIRIESIIHTDLSIYDLFISVDAQQLLVLANKVQEVTLPKSLDVVVIDHHKNNKKFGSINLVDPIAPATAEIIFLLSEDIGFEIDSVLANILIVGIIDDTGAFRFPSTTSRTFIITSQLIDKGADKDRAIFHLLFSKTLPELKFWSHGLELLQVDEEHHFAWVAFPYEFYKEHNLTPGGSGDFATTFLQSIVDTDFAFIITEREKGTISVSFRSRTGIDVSTMAFELGGGGHQYSSGARFLSDFTTGVEKITTVAKNYAKKTR